MTIRALTDDRHVLTCTRITSLEADLCKLYDEYLLPSTTFDETIQYVESICYNASTIEQIRQKPFIRPTTELFNTSRFKTGKQPLSFCEIMGKIILKQNQLENSEVFVYRPKNLYTSSSEVRFYVDKKTLFWGATSEDDKTYSPDKKFVEDLLHRYCVQGVDITELSDELIRNIRFQYSDWSLISTKEIRHHTEVIFFQRIGCGCLQTTRK